MPDSVSLHHPRSTTTVFDLAEARARLAARFPALTRTKPVVAQYRSTCFGDAPYHQAAIDADRPRL